MAYLLEEEGLDFKYQVRVAAVWRLNFLLRMDWGLCVVEVDKGAHCIRAGGRMLKVRARHIKEPLRFVRCHSDCFVVSGQLAEVPQSEQHARLLRAVRKSPCQNSRTANVTTCQESKART